RICRQYAAPMRQRINQTTASDQRPRVEHGIAADLCLVANNGSEFSQTSLKRLPVDMELDGLAIQAHVGQDNASRQVRLIAQDRIADIVKVRHLGFVKYKRVLKLTRIAQDNAISNDYVFANVAAASDLAVLSNPGWSFDGRSVFNYSAFANINVRADKAVAEGLPENSRT